MKSQLNRILNSDLSQYKIAVNEHISSMDHFQECLTQRSNFIQNFNDFLKKQLQRINKNPPSQFNDVDPQPTFRYSQISNKELTSNLSVNNDQEKTYNQMQIQQKNNTFSQLTQYKCRCKSFIYSILQEKKKQFHALSQQVSYLRQSIKTQMVMMRKKVLFQIQQKMSTIIQKLTKNYCLQIKDFLTSNHKNKISMESSQINNQKKSNSFLLKQKMCELQQRSKQLALNQKKKYQNRQRLYGQKYSPINHINYEQKCIEQGKQLVKIKSIQTIQYADLSNDLNQLNRQTCIKTQQQFEQIQLQKLKMTVNNTVTQNWKHFICDLQSPIMKQVKNISHRNGKQNIITQMESNLFVSKQMIKMAESQSRNEPNLPILLRKDVQQKSYDIPSVRAISVSYPPVEEGFSILKLGNQIIYRGMWKNKKFHGKGQLMLPQYQYEGQFHQGLFQGRGNLKVGQIQFIGSFFQNKAQGQGKIKIGNKQVAGRWKKNILIQKY